MSLTRSLSSSSISSEATYEFEQPIVTIADLPSLSSDNPVESVSDSVTTPPLVVDPPLTMTTLILDGVTYTRNTTKKAVSARIEPVLHKKQDRAKLPPEDRTSLFEKATKTAHKKFDLLPLALNDEEKLDDTYSLDVLIRKMKRQHCSFDMQDVFTIIYPDATDEYIVANTLDLYSEFAKISIEDVARSNLWYRKWLPDPWFEENLQLTYDYFQQNVSDDLWMKVCETYDQYQASEQGGPLFFILMMNHLLSDTEEAASSLVLKITDFKITNVRGEDIYKVVSLLRGACNRLKHINKLPEDIVKTLLTVFQTSSVDSFNETFHLLQKTRKHAAVLSQTGSLPSLTTDKIFKLAESDYRDMLQDSLWTGVTTTTGASTFAAGDGQPPLLVAVVVEVFLVLTAEALIVIRSARNPKTPRALPIT
jgi:ferredoxin-fold anticodon binding domain-containing protein